MTRKQQQQQQQQKFNEKFLLLLEEQYSFVEEYANAQTFMLNATITTTTTTTASRLSSSSSSSLPSSSSSSDEAVINAIERLDKARSNVRSNMKDLQEQEEIQNQNHQIQNSTKGYQQQQNHQRYYTKNHINLSRRVIETISNNPAWYTNGLPKPTTSSSSSSSIDNNNNNNNSNNSLQTNTIAIAALKASIARIREIEETI
jgi:uncharacterized protein (UPF0335 family)